MTDKKQETVKVVRITENSDGSADLELDLSEEFVEDYLKITGQTEFDEDDFRKFFLEAIKTSIENEKAQEALEAGIKDKKEE